MNAYPHGNIRFACYETMSFEDDVREIEVLQAESILVNGDTPLQKWLPYPVMSSEHAVVEKGSLPEILDFDRKTYKRRSDYPNDPVSEVVLKVIEKREVLIEGIPDQGERPSAAGPGPPESRYEGFDRDRMLIRKTVLLKPSLNASSSEAVAASVRIFERVPFLFKTRGEVLRLLGDPATISDYGQRAVADPDSPLVYRFDTGHGGIEYTIGFSGGKVNRVREVPME